jgi:hypothetical protein
MASILVDQVATTRGKRAGTQEQLMASAGALALLWVGCRF